LKEHYTLDSPANVPLTDSVLPSSICSKQPVHVCRNLSFVVNLQRNCYFETCRFVDV